MAADYVTALAKLKQSPPSVEPRPEMKESVAQLANANRIESTAQGVAAAAAAAQPDIPAQAEQTDSKSGPLPSGPSFDCSNAKSANEHLICSDAELAALDRDLYSAFLRARSLANDQASFRAENVAAFKQREATCKHDKPCLVEWYSRRKTQLLAAGAHS